MQEQNVNTKVPEVEDTTTDYLLLFIVAIFKLALLTLLTLLIPIFIRKLLIIIRKRLMINRSVALSPFNNGHCFGSNSTIPRSVNYHFTRQCNYKCGFCFHTAKTSFVLPLDEAKRGLKILKEAGRNNNFYKRKLSFEAKRFLIFIIFAIFYLETWSELYHSKERWQ